MIYRNQSIYNLKKVEFSPKFGGSLDLRACKQAKLFGLFFELPNSKKETMGDALVL